MSDTGEQGEDAVEAARRGLSRRRPGRPHDRRGRRVRRRRGGWVAWGVRRTAGFIFAALVLVALTLGLAHHRLRQGPISLGPAAGWIAERMAAAGDGLGVEIGDAVFALGEEGEASGLRLLDVRITGADGERLFAAPELAAGFRLSDLVRGEALPTALEVRGVSGTILRDADGRVRLDPAVPASPADAGSPSGETPPPPGASTAGMGGLAGLIRAAEADEGPLRRLRRLSAHDASLRLIDRTTGRIWIADQAELTVLFDPDGQTAALTARIGPEGGDPTEPDRIPATLAIAGRRDAVDGTVSAELRLTEADLDDLARALPELAPLEGIEARGEARIALSADAEGRPEAFEAELELAAGRLAALPDPAGRFDAASLSLAWSAADGRLRLRRAEVEGPLGAAVLSGELTPWPTPDGGPPRGYAVALQAERLDIAAEAGFAAPLSFLGASLEADLLLAERRLEVARLSLRGDAVSLTAQGSAETREDGVAVTARLRSDGFAAEALVAHWPLEAAPGARRWLAENLIGGRVGAVDAWIWSEPGGAPELTLDFAFEDLASRVVVGMPPVRGAHGAGRATLDRLDLRFDAGTAAAPGAGAADLAGSRFSIPDLTADVPVAEARLTARAAIVDALALMDQPPLRLVSRLGADLGEIAGRAEVEASLSLPMLRDLPIEDVQVSAAATLRDVALTAPGTGIAVSAEALSLEADTRALSLSGPARLAGLPARIAWSERYGGEAGRTLSVRARVDDAALDRLGFGAVTIRDGAVDARLRIDGVQAPVMRLDADLTDAALRAAQIGWAKRRGAEGRLQATARFAGGGVQVSGLDLEAPGLIAQGAVALDGEGDVVRARLDRLRLRRALDVGLQVDREEGGGYAARISGARIDLGRLSRVRRALDAAAEADGEGGTGDALEDRPVSAEIAVNRVVAADGLELRRARGQVSRRGGVTRASVRGRVNGGVPAQLRYRQGRDGDAVLTLRSGDAGALLSDVGLSEAARGGALTLRARIPPEGEGDITGVARIETIVLGGVAALGRIVEEAREDGVEAQEVSGGYAFDTIRVPFTLLGDRLEVRNALAEGPSLGVKIGGAFERESGVLDFTGVLTPAYRLNSLLNDVPLIGALLGGRGEGLVGLTFAVSGPREAPEVSVNPFSVLAPGVLRRLVQSGPEIDIPPDLFEEIDR